MFGRINHFLPAVAGILGVATVWAGAGYLPEAGPVHLRFRVQNSPAPVQANPPVLAPGLPPPCLPTPLMPPEQPESSEAQPAIEPVPMSVTNGPALEYDARNFAPGPAGNQAPEAVVSPQMLIKYFAASTNAATNGGGTEVMTPFGFIPPAVMTAGPTSSSKGAPTTSH